jgi:LAO/AO transport system kinase
MKNHNYLPSKILEGNERALAKAISMIENQEKEGIEILKKLYKKGGKAKVIGFTGPPGAGKSTIIQCLASILSERSKVGIIAVDPTSPFTGGALLGDRIRMQNLFTNPNIFIRSMATRGSIGGLAPMTLDVVDLLDIAGYEWILVETIGVGQDEVDVAMCVEEVVVVLVPGLGDEIQALKAGIMEIGDIFVINKADKDGSELTYMEIKNFLEMEGNKDKMPKIVKTKAISMEGISELAEILKDDLKRKEKEKNLTEKKKNQLKTRLFQMLTKEFQNVFNQKKELEKTIEDLFWRKTDPYTAVEVLKKEILC